MRLFIALIAFVAFIPVTAMSQHTNNDPKPPKSLQELVNDGAQIYYLGEYEGMKGWAIVRDGQPEYFYENRDRTALVMGLMFNEDGEVVTIGQLQALYDRIGDDMYAATGGKFTEDFDTTPTQIPSAPNVVNNTTTPITDSVASEKPQQSNTPQYRQLQPHEVTPAHRMYTDLAQSKWITMNDAGLYEVAVFIDPECPHCRNLIKTLAPVIEEKQIKLRIIPVGMSDSALKKAAILLASANPIERLVNYVMGDGEALIASDSINTTAVENNVSTMLKYGFDVTPVIVYRTLDNQIRMIRGIPASYDVIVDDIINN